MTRMTPLGRVPSDGVDRVKGRKRRLEGRVTALARGPRRPAGEVPPPLCCVYRLFQAPYLYNMLPSGEASPPLCCAYRLADLMYTYP